MALQVRLTQQLRRVDIAQRCLRQLRQESGQRPWASALLGPIGALLGNIDEDMRLAIDIGADGSFGRGTIDTCARLADGVTTLLHEVRGAHGRRAPQPFRQALTSLATHLLYPQSDGAANPEPLLLITSGHSPRNYHIRTDLLERLAVICREAFEGVCFPQRFAILQCPGAEYDDVLQHAAIFHELGHAFRDWMEINLQPVEDEVNRASSAYLMGDIAGELHADAFAVRAAGPAPAFAVAVKTPDGGLNESHPPRADRIHLALLCLGPHKDGDEFVRWAHGTLAQQGGGDSLGFESAVKRTARVVSETPEYSSLDPYAASKPHDRVMALTERICAYLPPDTLGEVPDICLDARDAAVTQEWCARTMRHVPSVEDISNAGWYVRLDAGAWGRFCAGLGKTADANDEQYEAERKLNNLLLKALETVELLRSVATQWGGEE